MERLRRRLAWIACAWLCCHLSVLTAAPVSLLSARPAAELPGCTCIHGANAQCPMHHPVQPPSNCQRRSTSDPGAATLVSLLGPTAVLSSAPQHPAPSSITRSPDHQLTRFDSVVTAPDGPPPRT